MRLLPSFVMIGGQRCGTTSLFRALMAHPQVVRPAFHKGINFFDLNYYRGMAWYRGHFPVAPVAEARTARHGGPVPSRPAVTTCTIRSRSSGWHAICRG